MRARDVSLSKGPKMVAKRAQKGARWPQRKPKGLGIPRLQDGTQMVTCALRKEGPKMAPRWPRWPQDGSKMAQDGPKLAPRWPKMAPREPKDGPRWTPERPKRGPKRVQNRSSKAFQHRSPKRECAGQSETQIWAVFGPLSGPIWDLC